jgi:tyrosine-protein phosphatase YwqE
MSDCEQKQLLDALRGPLEYEILALNAAADEFAELDLKAITPIVEEIERNAEARGRFAQLLELTYERWRTKTQRAA